MNVGYPALRSKLDGFTVLETQKGPFGVQEVLISGFQKAKNEIGNSHPLEYMESKYDSNQEMMEFSMLRHMQGLHAPLRLKIERQIVGQFQRLPGLHSSRIMFDSLTGRLDEITFDDILNDPMDAEMVGHSHLLMEKHKSF